MSKLLYKCMTKATTAEGDQMKRGPNWVLSRRGNLHVFEDHLECGDWNIPYAEIEDSVLYSYRSLLGYPGYVLNVETKSTSYHFGLNWGRFWKGDLPFNVRREKGKLGYSIFSIIVRMFLLGTIGCVLYKKFL